MRTSLLGEIEALSWELSQVRYLNNFSNGKRLHGSYHHHFKTVEDDNGVNKIDLRLRVIEYIEVMKF